MSIKTPTGTLMASRPHTKVHRSTSFVNGDAIAASHDTAEAFTHTRTASAPWDNVAASATSSSRAISYFIAVSRAFLPMSRPVHLVPSFLFGRSPCFQRRITQPILSRAVSLLSPQPDFGTTASFVPSSTTAFLRFVEVRYSLFLTGGQLYKSGSSAVKEHTYV